MTSAISRPKINHFLPTGVTMWSSTGQVQSDTEMPDPPTPKEGHAWLPEWGRVPARQMASDRQWHRAVWKTPRPRRPQAGQVCHEGSKQCLGLRSLLRKAKIAPEDQTGRK